LGRFQKKFSLVILFAFLTTFVFGIMGTVGFALFGYEFPVTEKKSERS